MVKLIVAGTLTGMGVIFWRYPVFFSGEMETLPLATILWVLALFLLMSFLLEVSTRGPWR